MNEHRWLALFLMVVGYVLFTVASGNNWKSGLLYFAGAGFTAWGVIHFL